jgi:hypothetical protein
MANTYMVMYRGVKKELVAESSYAAQKLATILFKAKKSYDVTVVLLEKDGNAVVHSTAAL